MSTINAWQCYTATGAPFDQHPNGIAVEPMTAPANAFRSGDHLTVIEPGKSVTTVVRYEVTVKSTDARPSYEQVTIRHLHNVYPVCDNSQGLLIVVKESIMGMRGRKRKDRRKKAANHGKRPNA